MSAAVGPRVSVVVPCRNEARDISAFVETMLDQEVPEGGFELIIADGCSSDGTSEILQRLSSKNPRIRIIENQARVVSTGLNLAIAAARGTVVIRADVHTDYARDYLRQCVAVLTETGADCVGGPWRAVGSDTMSEAIAAVFQSRFGSGGARGHDITYEGPVDTVYLGCWTRETLIRIGAFDTELVRNQDDELSLRLVRNGGRIWQSPRIRSSYHPRRSLAHLFRQYTQYGYWKVRVIQKHGTPASWRHLVPPLFVFALLMLGLASTVSPSARRGAALMLALYGAGTLAASIGAARTLRPRTWILLPIVFATFHVGYGWGFLRGLIDFVVLRRSGAASMSLLTRSEG
jgi:glycosyltransferase involved in cell wall biosynthesis